MANRKLYGGLRSELNRGLDKIQKEGENEGLILKEAERKVIIIKLDRWEFNNLDHDGGTLEFKKKLRRKTNYATDVLMADWNGEEIGRASCRERVF